MPGTCAESVFFGDECFGCGFHDCTQISSVMFSDGCFSFSVQTDTLDPEAQGNSCTRRRKFGKQRTDVQSYWIPKFEFCCFLRWVRLQETEHLVCLSVKYQRCRNTCPVLMKPENKWIGKLPMWIQYMYECLQDRSLGRTPGRLRESLIKASQVGWLAHKITSKEALYWPL